MTSDHEPDPAARNVSSSAAVRDDLLTLGPPDPRGSWLDYRSRGIGEEHIALLMEVVQRQETDPDQREVPGAYAAVHAWRALGQLGAAEAAPTLIAALESYADDDWTIGDLPTALALLGPEVFEPVAEVLTDTARDSIIRAAAGEALGQLATAHSEQRSRVGDALAGVLAESDAEPFLLGLIVADLIDINGVEWVAQIEGAYAAERVDLQVCGDWEDVQIELGLLDERLTPPRPGAPGSGVGLDVLEHLERAQLAEERRREAQKARGKPLAKQKSKAKKKSRQARKSRRKNRKK